MLNGTVPGSREVLEWARTSKEKIHVTLISENRADDKATCIRMHNELYGLLMRFCESRAAVVIRAIDPREDLEGWRRLWSEIGQRDEQTAHDEWRSVTNPKPVAKISHMNNFINLWEVHMSNVKEIDPTEYTIGPQQRYDTLLNVMPASLREQVES